ncbi:TPA: deoxyhypusine synthase [Candidatus Geothermarchaeota archaeon]|nr:deoxyhypusine synthase [Candidatus Geothermarchaeota archaeon]HIQ13257.1 deoxyhypusine synthase [Thermoprotei archaeon]
MMDKVQDIDLDSIHSFSDMMNQLINSGGFMGRYIGHAYKIWSEMLERRGEITIFMSFPADIMATGLRGVIREIVRRRWVDVVITTCGTLDHDLARSYRDYYMGEFDMDDIKLRDSEIHRLGNILIPFDSYGGVIQEVMSRFLNDLKSRGVEDISTYELCSELGRFIDSESSVLTWAYKKNVKVIVPGIYDGAVGYQIWVFQQFNKNFRLNLFKDEKLLSDYVYNAKSTGGVIIGGGISKHHLIWWNQFREGLDYAIQITTAIEYDGSLSGARLSEAVTWNKVGKYANHVSIWGDVTTILPFIVKALMEAGH